MTNRKSCLVFVTAVGFAVASGLAFAQDDLDALLKDLEGARAKQSAPAKTPVKVEAPAPAKVEAPVKVEAPRPPRSRPR